MAEDRTHRTVSDDGTEIVATVHGQGPPLVLVHGAFEDGNTCWASLLPLLSDRFTCYALSLRGRGLSGHSSELGTDRLVQDVTAFVDSVGERVGLVGESGGGFSALGAAARTDAVAAVALYEPVVFEVQSQQDAARFEDTAARARDAAAAGRPEEAIAIFAGWLANDDELAALSASDDAVEALAVNVPVQLEEFRQQPASRGPSPTDPTELAKISAPTLIMHGSRTALHTWFGDGVQHVAQHVPNAYVREIEGAGHFGVALEPQPIADELVQFLEGSLISQT